MPQHPQRIESTSQQASFSVSVINTDARSYAGLGKASKDMLRKTFPVAVRFMNSTLGRQSLVYFTAQITNALLGIILYIILTRIMSVEGFGSYAFIISFLTFTAVFFDFGISSAGMRLMALVQTEEESRQRLGTLLLISGVIGAGFALFIFAASFVVDSLFTQKVGGVLRLLAPLAFVFPLQEMVISATQGNNRIGLLSVFTLLPRIILVVSLVVSAIGSISLELAVFITLSSILAALGFTIISLKPILKSIHEELRMIGKELREFGREVYYGRIVDGLTNGADRLLISFFHGMVPLGFYSIAFTMTSPIGMMSRSIATSSYQRFAHSSVISRKLLFANFLWCALGVVVLVFACKTLIPLFFTENYTASLSVLPFLAVGIALAGLNSPYHAFLSAQRQGRSIKKMSVSTSLLNVALNILLVPFFAMIGAAIALIVSYGLNIIMNMYYYRRFLHEQNASALLSHTDVKDVEYIYNLKQEREL